MIYAEIMIACGWFCLPSMKGVSTLISPSPVTKLMCGRSRFNLHAACCWMCLDGPSCCNPLTGHRRSSCSAGQDPLTIGVFPGDRGTLKQLVSSLGPSYPCTPIFACSLGIRQTNNPHQMLVHPTSGRVRTRWFHAIRQWKAHLLSRRRQKPPQATMHHDCCSSQTGLRACSRGKVEHAWTLRIFPLVCCPSPQIVVYVCHLQATTF